MVEFNFAEYFQNVADKNKLLHPDPAKPLNSFHRASSLLEMEGLINSSNSANGFQLVIIDNEDGAFIHNSDLVLDQPVYSFFLLRNFKTGDMVDRHEAITQCKSLMKSILSKMFADSRAEAMLQSSNGLRNLTNIKYFTSPDISNFIGVQVSFMLQQPPHISFNSNEWHG